MLESYKALRLRHREVSLTGLTRQADKHELPELFSVSCLRPGGMKLRKEWEKQKRFLLIL
jgi:hypothetical protein